MPSFLAPHCFISPFLCALYATEMNYALRPCKCNTPSPARPPARRHLRLRPWRQPAAALASRRHCSRCVRFAPPAALFPPLHSWAPLAPPFARPGAAGGGGAALPPPPLRQAAGRGAGGASLPQPPTCPTAACGARARRPGPVWPALAPDSQPRCTAHSTLRHAACGAKGPRGSRNARFALAVAPVLGLPGRSRGPLPFRSFSSSPRLHTPWLPRSSAGTS